MFLDRRREVDVQVSAEMISLNLPSMHPLITESKPLSEINRKQL